MPDPASITLSREGVSVTVKVGDVVPMTDGTKAKVKTIDSTNVPIEIVTSSRIVTAALSVSACLLSGVSSLVLSWA